MWPDQGFTEKLPAYRLMKVHSLQRRTYDGTRLRTQTHQQMERRRKRVKKILKKCPRTYLRMRWRTRDQVDRGHRWSNPISQWLRPLITWFKSSLHVSVSIIKVDQIKPLFCRRVMKQSVWSPPELSTSGLHPPALTRRRSPTPLGMTTNPSTRVDWDA